MMITIKKYYTIHIAFLFCSLFVLNSAMSQSENWTHFRGNRLNGIANSVGSPINFNDTLNVKWKTEIPGKGLSSPVIFEDQVWITSASEDGKELFAVCLDFESGDITNKISLFTPDSVMPKSSLNSYATPTPCIENGFVYAHFGSLGTACINTFNGEVVWKRSDLKCDHMQGPGSSPVLYKDLLILHFDGNDVRFIVALKKLNGELVWLKERPLEIYEQIDEASRKAYITPIIINVNGKDMLISNGAGICSAYEPQTGEEIWRVIRGTGGTISMPFYEDEVIYFYTGSLIDKSGKKISEILAINPEGKGDITNSGILWKKEVETLQLLTPVVKNDLIYTVDTRNVLTCIDAKTSETIWTKKLNDKYNSSPVYASGNIYFSSVRGNILVIREGRKPDIISQNQMEGDIWATPAILRGSIILRTIGNVYRICK
jgi:outer membrane protein assembly factor BamB